MTRGTVEGRDRYADWEDLGKILTFSGRFAEKGLFTGEPSTTT
jgi:hypothetical protein